MIANMYFEKQEQNQTRLYIINSLLELLKKKEYSAITINMIVDNAGLGRRTFYRYFKTKDDAMKYITTLILDEFADTLMKNHASGMEQVAIAYFQSMEQYIDVLLLLKKAHVLYFIEDNLTDLIIKIAQKIKHIPSAIPVEQLAKFYSKYNYEFSIKLAGFWKATIIWCEESPRKSPEEMAKIITSLFS